MAASPAAVRSRYVTSVGCAPLASTSENDDAVTGAAGGFSVAMPILAEGWRRAARRRRSCLGRRDPRRGSTVEVPFGAPRPPLPGCRVETRVPRAILGWRAHAP